MSLNQLGLALKNTNSKSRTPVSMYQFDPFLIVFIIKFPYNARSDWLKQRALSEIRQRVDGIKLASKYLLRKLDKFDPNYKHPLCASDKNQYKRAICQQ